MLNHFLQMGGYGSYVWSAYSITGVIFIVNLSFVFKERKHVKKLVQQFLSRQTQSL